MHSFEHILAALTASGATSGRLYDASCGGGASSNAYLKRGYDVTCSAYVGRPKELDPRIRCIEGVDLNRRLPFEDESFDVAVLEEVIEHLENPAHVIREFSRVLKPGGRWVMTTPNAGVMRSRVHFLLTGFVKGRRKPANYNAPPGNYTNLFIPSFPTLHYLSWSYGLRIAATGRGFTKPSSLVWGALLGPLVALYTWIYTRAPREYASDQQAEACRDLRRWMLSRHFLLDENLILVFEKKHSARGLYSPGA